MGNTKKKARRSKVAPGVPGSRKLRPSRLAAKLGVEGFAWPAEKNPEAPEADAGHWAIQLVKEWRRLDFLYTGDKNGKAPSTNEILHWLAFDANMLECSRSFKEWAFESGFDQSDTVQAKRVYAAVKTRTKKLRAFLGFDHYDVLLASE